MSSGKVRVSAVMAASPPYTKACQGISLLQGWKCQVEVEGVVKEADRGVKEVEGVVKEADRGARL